LIHLGCALEIRVHQGLVAIHHCSADLSSRYARILHDDLHFSKTFGR
jgi:hypothetical protein